MFHSGNFDFKVSSFFCTFQTTLDNDSNKQTNKQTTNVVFINFAVFFQKINPEKKPINFLLIFLFWNNNNNNNKKNHYSIGENELKKFCRQSLSHFIVVVVILVVVVIVLLLLLFSITMIK